MSTDEATDVLNCIVTEDLCIVGIKTGGKILMFGPDDSTRSVAKVDLLVFSIRRKLCSNTTLGELVQDFVLTWLVPFNAPILSWNHFCTIDRDAQCAWNFFGEYFSLSKLLWTDGGCWR